MEIEKAYQHCMEITRNHYENFPVASKLIPSAYRPHIAAVYAFARTADDFADEAKDREKLLDWRKQLQNCVQGEISNPIFLALANTIDKFQLPVELLDNLCTAFLMDLDKNRFGTFDDLLGYCKYSANPVGRIVLWLFGFREEKTMRDADHLTSALQLTNFWQDISIDLHKGRIYIPVELMNRYGVGEEDILTGQFSTGFGLLMTELIKKTRALYQRGAAIFSKVKGRLGWELKLTILGGMTILEKVEQEQYRIFHNRPVLSKSDWAKIAARASFKSF